MRHDLRRRGFAPALSILTACGVAVLAGCSSQPAGPARFDGGNSVQNTAAAVTAQCPKVADALPDIRVTQSVRRAVARNLGLLEIQVAAANVRLAETATRDDAAAAQQAVLGSLANQRAVTIDRIADAIDGVAQRPQNLGALANCTLSNGAAGVAPSNVPDNSGANGAGAGAGNGTGNGAGNGVGDGTGNGASAQPTGGAQATNSAVPSASPTASPTAKAQAKAANASAAPASANPTANATGNSSASPTASASASPTGSAASPVPTASAGAVPPAVNTRLLVCPSVASEIVIPRTVKSDVALELGLMELQESGANERLAALNNGSGANPGNNGSNTGNGNAGNGNTGNGAGNDNGGNLDNNGNNGNGNGNFDNSVNGVEGFDNAGNSLNGVNNGSGNSNTGSNTGSGNNGAGNNGVTTNSNTSPNPWVTNGATTAANADQDAILQGLARDRAASLTRIANLLNRAGGRATQDLGNLVNCQLNNGDAFIDSSVPTAAPPAYANAVPTPTDTAAPTQTAAPNDNGGNGNNGTGNSGVGNNGVDNSGLGNGGFDDSGAGNGSNFGNGGDGLDDGTGGNGDGDVWFADEGSGF